jgi:hypothetical protein
MNRWRQGTNFAIVIRKNSHQCSSSINFSHSANKLGPNENADQDAKFKHGFMVWV